ncbi:MAG: EutN/CcmL family microcompartment protein [Oscillospiraceae bacterium]|jgi:ethanolamine utilization protein EutN
MLIGKIIGNVWATRKSDGLNGYKLMIVQPYQYKNHAKAYPVVAVDTIGAGIGEMVLVVSGSSARLGAGDHTRPIDHTIVGIIDRIDLQEE